MTAHRRIRPFNTRDTYPEQKLDNDLCQAVVARGTMVFLRGQVAQDLDTRQSLHVGDAAQQTAKTMANIKLLMEEAGGSLDNIGSMKVYVKDREVRPLINKIWQEVFTNEKSRPVRHMVPFDLPPGRVCQLEFIAVV